MSDFESVRFREFTLALAKLKSSEDGLSVSSSTGNYSIAFAELFSFLLVLRWLDSSEFNNNRNRQSIQDFHFMTDSSFARNSLCNSRIPQRFFFLIQEIRHLAASLSSQYNFIIHWIPSHMKELSLGWHNIPGSDRADALANTAREKSMEMGDIEYIQEYDIIYIIWGRIRK